MTGGILTFSPTVDVDGGKWAISCEWRAFIDSTEVDGGRVNTDFREEQVQDPGALRSYFENAEAIARYRASEALLGHLKGKTEEPECPTIH